MSIGLKNSIKTNSFKPLRDCVFVCELDQGVKQTKSGIIIPDDNMTGRGVRERWGKVYAVGPEIEDLKVGEWVLLQHGRWTNGIDLELPDGEVRIWRVDYPEAVLLVSQDDPREVIDRQL